MQGPSTVRRHVSITVHTELSLVSLQSEARVFPADLGQTLCYLRVLYLLAP